MTMRLARMAAVLALGAAMLGGTAAAAPPASAAPGTTAAAQTCAAAKSLYLPNRANRIVSMRYIECRRTYQGRAQSSTAMWLWDNRDHDGFCAVGYVDIGDDFSHHWSWCDATKASPKFISGWHDGADARVWLNT